MHHLKLITLAGSALLLASCSSLSEEECKLGDWNAIGLADGSKGRESAAIEDHRKACAEVGVRPDLSAYLAGRERGLQSYCTPGNGYQEGLHGRAYEGVCPQASEQAFVAAHGAGLEVHRAKHRIDALEHKLRGTLRKIDKLEKKRDRVRGRPITSVQDGEAVRNELVSLDSKLDDETGDRRAYETEIELLKRQLIRLEERHRTGRYD